MWETSVRCVLTLSSFPCTAKPKKGGMQAAVLPTETEGESAVYRSLYSPERLLDHFVPEVTTLYENFKYVSIPLLSLKEEGKP